MVPFYFLILHFFPTFWSCVLYELDQNNPTNSLNLRITLHWQDLPVIDHLTTHPLLTFVMAFFCWNNGQKLAIVQYRISGIRIMRGVGVLTNYIFCSWALQIANLGLEFHSLSCCNRSIIHWRYRQFLRPDDSTILGRTILVAVAFFIGTSIVLKTFANMVWWFISVEEKVLFSWKKTYLCNQKLDHACFHSVLGGI